jgi:protein-S-isoprenylcysteine O-methyltransferase Ste14
MLGFIYGVGSYLAFLAVFTYFALFSDGVLVPKSVDSGLSGGTSTALLVDAGLMLLFGLQHSIMARAAFKRALTRVVPAHLERTTFVLVSSTALALLMWQWRPIDGTVWSVDNGAVATSLWAVNAMGWLGVPAVSFMIDHFDLFGLKQSFDGFRRRSVERKGFVTPLLYRYMRHPMMTAFFVAVWVTPHMTAGHALLSVGMSLYIVIGVHFEERSLARELGAPYVRYQASTSKFLPFRSTR